MRRPHPRKRPRSHQGRDRRVSPHTLLSKLPIAQSLDERHVPSTGLTRHQQRKIERKNKRKRKSSFRAHLDDGEQVTGTATGPGNASVSSRSKHGQPKHLDVDAAPRKRRKPNTVKQTTDTSNAREPDHLALKPGASTGEDPDSREIHRLERLLGIPKRKPAGGTSNRYEAIFDETEADLLDLVRSCDQTLNRTSRTVHDDRGEKESEVEAGEDDHGSEMDSKDSFVESLASAEEEGISENKNSDAGTAASSDHSEENVPYVAKWKRGASNHGRSQNGAQSRFSVKALQGLLNRVSASNTADIAKKISSLYPKNLPTAEREELASSYAVAVLEAINQGNTMGATNPYLRAHVEVVLTLGTTVDMTLLSRFVTTCIKRLRACLESDSEHTLSDLALHMSHIFGYIVALCAAYELGVLSSGFIYETLMWVAEPLCKTRLDAALKLLKEAGPLLRKRDPAAFADVVKFVHGQSQSGGDDGDAKSSSNETSCRLIMLTDVVENIRNNRIKVTKGISPNVENSSAYSPFQASLMQLLEDGFTSTRWCDDIKQNTPTREGPRGGHQRPNSDIDHETSRISRLAAALRLHTDSRRGLLAAIMNSVSCPDAIQRIDRLGTFTSKQKLKDLTFILTHCCRAEKPYNKFYALLANRVCQKSREARFAMEFTIQDAIKGTDCYDSEDRLSRKTQNLARYLGDLWALEGLPLSMLRRKPDLEDISAGEQNFYTASIERMASQRKAAGMDPSVPFRKLKRETVAGGDLFCSSLAVFLRRHVHPQLAGSVQPLVAKAITGLEGQT